MKKADLHRPLRREFAGVLLAGKDSGNRFGAVFANVDSLPVCTVVGYFIRPDGVTLKIPGNVVGNTAYVDLPQECYTMTGRFSFSLKVQTSGATTTVRMIDGFVKQTVTNEVIEVEGGTETGTAALGSAFLGEMVLGKG